MNIKLVEFAEKPSENHPDVILGSDGLYYYECVNCGTTHRSTQDPYVIKTFCGGHTPPIIKRKMKGDEHPYRMCHHCGLNIFNMEDAIFNLYKVIKEPSIDDIDTSILTNYQIQDTIVKYPPNLRYNYGDTYSTTEIDVNKITKRLVFGDSYFGRPEPDMYGKRAYNGNETLGILYKLNNGWLQDNIAYWHKYLTNYDNLPRKDKSKFLYDRYYKLYHSAVQWYHGYEYTYIPELKGGLENCKFLLKFLRRYNLPDVILYECMLETFNEKFGVKPIKKVNVTISKNKLDIENEVIEL